MAQQHKTCTVCGETKPLDGFHKSRSGKYGVRSQCKLCVVESSRRYYEQNRDERLEYKRRYHEENREKELERSRRYNEANRDERLEYKRRYHEANREKELERSRRYWEENRDVDNAKRVKRLRKEQELTKALATVPPGTPYLPGEDALILSDNGMTIYQKAVELGRTLTSVRDRRRRLLEKLNA